MMAAAKPIRNQADRKGVRSSQCGRKRRYRKEHEAEAAARWVKAQAGEDMHAYPCRFCKGWHIGH